MEKTAGRIFPASFDTQSIQKRLQAEFLNEKNGGRLHDATAAYPHTAIYETNKSQNVRPALHATHRAEHFGLFIEGYTHAPNAYMAVAHGWENVRVSSLFAFAKQFLHLFDEVLFATFGISATAFGHLAVTVDYEYVGNHVHTHGTTEVAVRVEQYLVFPSL